MRAGKHLEYFDCAQLRACKSNVTITGMSETDNPHHPPWPADDPPLRRVTLWLPDTSVPGFAAEARRQSAQVAQGGDESHILDLLEDDTGWADK